MRLISFVVFCLPFACLAQLYSFKDSATGLELVDYYVEFNLENNNEFVFSDDNNKLKVDDNLIKKSKNIFLHYGFQKIKIEKNQFKASTISILYENALDEILVSSSRTSKQSLLRGAYLGVKLPIDSGVGESLAINIEELQGKDITAFIIELKGSSLFVPNGHGSRFELKVYSADSDFKILKEVYPEPAVYTVNKKSSYDLKIDVRDLNIVVPDSKFLIMSLEMVSGRLTLKSAKKLKNPDHFRLLKYLDVNNKILFKPQNGLDFLPKMYFEYED
jgi:hypothetical protein